MMVSPPNTNKDLFKIPVKLLANSDGLGVADESVMSVSSTLPLNLRDRISSSNVPPIRMDTMANTMLSDPRLTFSFDEFS